MDNPFVGPQPFGQKNLIYGRDLEISELRYFLGAKRIVVLYSPSGAGKTSLIQARNGLVSKLTESGRFDVWGPARVNLAPDPLTVTNRFAWSVINGFEKCRPAGPRPPETFAHTKLIDYVNERATETSPLLIFDQFEEVLRTDAANTQVKHEFFDQLGELLYQPTVWALFVLREDWLPALQPYVRQIPTHLQNRFRMDLLRREDQAKAAVVEPLKAGGRRFFSDDVVNDLLNDLARIKVDGQEVVGDTVEPLQLQVVCQNLWSKIADRDPHEPIVRADIGDPSDALATYYRTNVRRDNIDEERQIRDWFENSLITEDGVRNLVLLEHDNAAGLPIRIVAELESSYLFRKESRAGATWIELCHDRLVEPIRHDNKEWRLRSLSTLQKAADLWLDRGRSSDVLLRGPSLVDAKLWASEHVLLPFEQDFLNASLAEEQSRAAARVVRYVILSLGVIAIALGIWALKARASAIESELRAQASANAALIAKGKAEKAEETALTQEQRARRSAVRADLTLVAQQSDSGAVNQALAYLARALNTSPESVTARAWAAGLLGRGNHRLPLREFIHDGPVDLVAFAVPSTRIITTQSRSRSALIQMWDTKTGDKVAKPLITTYGVRTIFGGPSGTIITVPDTYPDHLPTDAKELPRGAFSIWTWRGRWVEQPVGSFDASGPIEASLTPDLQQLIVLSGGQITTWNLATRQPVGEPLHLDLPIQQFALSRSGKLLVARTARAAVIARPGGPALATAATELTQADISWDDRRLITASKFGVTVWSINLDQTAHAAVAAVTSQVFDRPVNKAMIAPDGRLITVAGGDISAWDLSATPIKLVLNYGRIDENASQWDLSPNGRQLMVISNQLLTIWEVHTGDQVAQVQHSGWISHAVFSRDGKSVIAGSDDRTASLWNVGNKQSQSRRFPQPSYVRDIAFDPQDRLVVATSNGLFAWKTDPQDPPSSQTPQHILAGQSVSQLAYHGTLLHTVSWNAKSARWEVNLWQDGQQSNQAPMSHRGRIAIVAVSPDGHRVFTSSSDGTGRLWDAATGQPIGDPMWHGRAAAFAQFTADGQHLYSAAGHNLFSWDLATGKLARLYPFQADISAGALLPNGTTALLGFNDPTGRLRLQTCDLATGKSVELERHTAAVLYVAVSGNRALTAALDGQDGAQLWDVSGPKPLPIGPPLLHNGDITAALFNASGTLAVTASSDKTAQVWDAASGLPLGQPLLHANEVNLAAFKNNYVATASDNYTVQVWDFKAAADKDPQAGRDLATLAEVVGGSRLSDDATLTRIPLEERRNLLRNLLRSKARHSPDVDAMIEQLAINSGLPPQ